MEEWSGGVGKDTYLSIGLDKREQVQRWEPVEVYERLLPSSPTFPPLHLTLATWAFVVLWGGGSFKAVGLSMESVALVLIQT